MTLIGDGEDSSWSSLVLSHADGTEIAAVERYVVEAGSGGSLGGHEVSEFLEEVAECRPASGAAWLTRFLPSVSCLYACQHLFGTERDRGDEALRAVEHSIWGLGDAILQADGEGFTNEDGFHILWQFSDDVSGMWWMAVLQDGDWLEFEMDLGDLTHREYFLAGRVPPGAKRR